MQYQTTGLSPDQAAGMAAFTGVYSLVMLGIAVLGIIAVWKIFTKAGEPGWYAIIPIWNTIVLLKIVGRPAWWIVLLLVPLVNFVVLLMVMNDLSKSFGQGMGFTIGLVLLSFVFMLILGFGKATYVGPGGAPATAYQPPAGAFPTQTA